jgi:hypothetical protein
LPTKPLLGLLTPIVQAHSRPAVKGQIVHKSDGRDQHVQAADRYTDLKQLSPHHVEAVGAHRVKVHHVEQTVSMT